MKPEVLENLIQSLAALPGISKKQAEKIAYLMIDQNQEAAKNLVASINQALSKLTHCQICNHLSDQTHCNICSDQTRLKTLIIVETPLDVFKFEETQEIKPYYHVLGTLIKGVDDQSVANLKINNLKTRAAKFKEIIIALSPNLEGIVTANYLKALLKGYKVTQLAQGIPLGAAMEYVDKLTLKAALENRKEVK